MFESNCTTNNCEKCKTFLWSSVFSFCLWSKWLSVMDFSLIHQLDHRPGFLIQISENVVLITIMQRCLVEVLLVNGQRTVNSNIFHCDESIRSLISGGKCSVCGEPFDQRNKEFSMGGRKYLGKIVRTYDQGSTIQVAVTVTFSSFSFVDQISILSFL